MADELQFTRPHGPVTFIAALDPKPWGGRKLERIGFRLPPDEPIGEAHLTGMGARVAEGPLAGQTLGEIVARDPAGTLGELGLAATGGLPLFPLLIKLIDAREVLSVQVHPGDAEAKPLGGVGKTEAWHVLEAGIDSKLYLGLRDPDGLGELANRARSGVRTGELLRSLPARPGETVLIPAGTIHALGGGTLIYEIQQPSGITYRFDDWGRLGSDGKPRELHIDESLAVTKAGLQPDPIGPIEIAPGRKVLTACRYFALERLHLPANQSITIDHPGSPAVITLLDGDGSIEAAGATVPIRPGETVVVFPTDLPATIRTSATTLTALHGWVPDLARDVVAPARAAGATDAEIAALSGPARDED